MLIARSLATFAIILATCLTMLPSKGYAGEKAVGYPFVSLLTDCANSLAVAARNFYTFFRPAHALFRVPLNEAPAVFRTFSPPVQGRTVEYLLERLRGRWTSKGFSHVQVHWLLPKLLRQIEDKSVFLQSADRLMALLEPGSSGGTGNAPLALSVFLSDPVLLRRLPQSYAERVHGWAKRDPVGYRDALVLVLGWQILGCEATNAFDSARRIRALSEPGALRRLFLMVEVVKANRCFESPMVIKFENEFTGLIDLIVKDLNETERRRWEQARVLFEARPFSEDMPLSWFIEGAVLSAMDKGIERRAYAWVRPTSHPKEYFLQYIFTDSDLRRLGYSRALLAAHLLIHPDTEKLSFSLAETNRRLFEGAGISCGPSDTSCWRTAFQRTPLSRALVPLGFTAVTHMDLDGRFPRFSVEWVQ